MRKVSIRYPAAPRTLNEEILSTYARAIEGDAQSQFDMG
jgi:hypothetical protein